jgi:2-keto-4-pentenoate hydratase/2-oxohepta-3-ene-1,7-dioic acid hydratase in catechol pathway
MRLVTFENSVRQSRIGALAGADRIVDLNSAYALHLRDVRQEGAYARLADAVVPTNMRELFEGGGTSLEAARTALEHARNQSAHAAGVHGEPIFYAVADIRLKPPIVPKKFFHTAGNFREHHEEATQAGFSHPVMPWIVFFQNVDAIIGHDEPVIYPEHLTQELDYELELAVVLKKGGKHFTPEEAGSHIGGYVIFNDITARDIQRREMKSGVFSFCKGIDTFCPLGPWIVTADEIPDPHLLAMELRVNGESRQRSHSGKMSVKIPEILSHYSPMGYSAGDVVSTGTVSGVAAFSGDPKAWYLKPGDVMECEIEKIGILRNRVISWQEAYGQKPVAMATQEALR